MKEALELTLDEQRRGSFVVALLELPEECLQMFADHLMEHALVRRTTLVGDMGPKLGDWSSSLHELPCTSRVVPLRLACCSWESGAYAGERRRDTGGGP